MNEEAREKGKLLSFLVASTGGNVTAPEQMVDAQLEKFSHIKQVDTNDALVDALVALSSVESQEERMEIICILIMKCLKLCTVLKFHEFITEYPEQMFDYFQDHPEIRENQEERKRSMDELFLGLK